MKTLLIRIVASFLAGAALPIVSLAQSAPTPPPSTGITRFGTFEGSPDTVNLGNLNVHLTQPIRTKPGRITGFNYALNFDSSVWSVVPSSGAGTTAYWSLNPPWTPTKFVWGGNYYQYVNSTLSLFTACVDTNGVSHGFDGYSYPGAAIVYNNFSYVDMAGVVHPVPGVIEDYNCASTDAYTYGSTMTNGLISGAFGGPATDGSGISAYINTSTYPEKSSVLPVVQFTVPGINTTTFAVFNGSSVVQMGEVDNNGNQISYTSAGALPNGYLPNGVLTPIYSITDTLGQTVLSTSEMVTYSQPSDPSSPVVSSEFVYSYQDGNGNNSGVTLHSSPYAVQTAFGCSGIAEYNQTTALPDYMTLPDGGEYLFTYEKSPVNSSAVTGRISRIQFPGGGSVSYTYGASNCDGTVLALTRTVNDNNGNQAVWQYTRSLSNGLTTIETDPLGNQKLLTFWQGASGAFYEASRQEYAGTVASGTLLRTTNTASANVSASGTSTANLEPVNQRTITSMLPNAAGKTNQVFLAYDYLGSTTQENIYDYGAVGAGVGPLLSQKTMQYSPIDDVFDTLAQDISIYPVAGGPPRELQHVYSMDLFPLVTTSGVPQHVSPPSSSRGNPNVVVTIGVNTATGQAATSTAYYSYYDTGEVATATEDSGQVTTYTYGQCGGGFATGKSQQVAGSGIVISSSTSWNCVGGVPTTSTDANGNVTSTFHNDSMWRLTGTIDPLGNTSSLSYPTPASNMSSVSMAYAGGIAQTKTVTRYDGFGRPILTQTQQGPGANTYSSVSTKYDLRGSVAWTSVPYSANLASYVTNGSGTTYGVDAIGRKISVTDPEGGTLTYTYNLNDTLVTHGPAASGERVKSRQLEYNGLNQLTSVCEITTGTGSGSCGQSMSATGFLTKYAYAGPLLTSVSENVQAGTSSTQTRTMTYDSFGRKIAEQIPETGTSSFTFDFDGSGVCPGRLAGAIIKTVDNAGNVTCFTYDSLHRPLSTSVVSGPYSSVTPQTHIVYDAASLSGIAMQNVMGGIAEAYTCTGSCTTKLTDVYKSSSFQTSNGNRTGQIVAQMWESTPHSTGYYLSQSVSYANGVPASISASLNGASIGLPNIAMGLDTWGRVNTATDITNNLPLVSGTAYNPLLGTVTGITYGNGDSDTYAYDPLTGRPSSFAFSVTGSSPLSMSGGLTWNPNGSLKTFSFTDSSDSSKNQSCGYQMDDINRLASVNCAGSWAQNFTYDPFGNISKAPPSNPGPGQITQSYLAGYNSINNQVSSGVSATYDANGNQTLAETNQLSWNASGQPVTVNGIGATYDALGRVVETASGNSYTQYIYSPGGHKIAIVNGGTLLKGTVPLPGGGSAIYNQAGLSVIRHKDWLGSSRLSTTWAHGVYAKEAYAPFGETYNEAGTPDRSFTGQDQDTTTGIFDYLFRRYDPVAGRWLSPDPAGWGSVSQSHPQSLNRYAYVQNNPLSLIDPNGEACIWNIGGSPSIDNTSSATDDSGCGDGVYYPGNNIQLSDLMQQPGTYIYDGYYMTMYSVAGSDAPLGITTDPASDLMQDIASALVTTPAEHEMELVALDAGEAAAPMLVPEMLPEIELGAATADVVLSGHGGLEVAGDLMTVPEGTTVTTYTGFRGGISDELGNAIETGGDLTPFADQMEGAQSYLPGAQMPNYTLYPPDGLTIMGNPVTVNVPTTLSDIIQANMGHVQWAACCVILY